MDQTIYAAAMTAFRGISSAEAALAEDWWQTPDVGSALAAAGVGRYFVDEYNGVCWYALAAPDTEPEPEPEPDAEASTIEEGVHEIFPGVASIRVVTDADQVTDAEWTELPADAPAVLDGVEGVIYDPYTGDIVLLIPAPEAPAEDIALGGAVVTPDADDQNAAAPADA